VWLTVCQVVATTDAKLLPDADVERSMRAVLNGLAEAKEDLPDLPKHVRRSAGCTMLPRIAFRCRS